MLFIFGYISSLEGLLYWGAELRIDFIGKLISQMI
jgi:hypothetical protein